MVALFLPYPHDVPPRQPKELWLAFSQVALPPSIKDFIRLALWRKLLVGVWNLLPLETHCQLDNAEESVAHSRTDCKFLPVAFDILDKCLPSQTLGSPTDTRGEFQRMSVKTLTTLPGLLAWAAVRANWKIQCS